MFTILTDGTFSLQLRYFIPSTRSTILSGFVEFGKTTESAVINIHSEMNSSHQNKLRPLND